jgi:hypothetical protein
MHRHRDLPSLGRLCGLALVKCCVLAAASLVLVYGGAGMAQVQQSGQPPAGAPQVVQVAPPTAAADPVARLMERFDCSTVGYGNGASPQSALVREPSGRVRAVTFDEGWAVYTARGERALVAVCLRPVRD